TGSTWARRRVLRASACSPIRRAGWPPSRARTSPIASPAMAERTRARAILLDIEGTTTDIRFVHAILFPLSVRELPGYVAAQEGSPEVERARAAGAWEQGLLPADLTAEALSAALLAWIAQDRKETALKELQGLIWKSSYESGALTSHVY